MKKFEVIFENNDKIMVESMTIEEAINLITDRDIIINDIFLSNESKQKLLNNQFGRFTINKVEVLQ